MLDEWRVKNHKLFEGVSPSFCDLATRFMHPKNAHGVSKIDFLRNHQEFGLQDLFCVFGDLDRISYAISPYPYNFLAAQENGTA